MNFQNNKIKKIINFFSRIPNILIDHLYIILFCILVFNLALVGFLFYQYYLQERDITFENRVLKLNEKLLNDILEEWGKKEELFKAVDSKEYLDLFRF